MITTSHPALDVTVMSEGHAAPAAWRLHDGGPGQAQGKVSAPPTDAHGRPSLPLDGRSRLRTAASTFAAEAMAFFSAILSPDKITADVEKMAALQREATRLESTDPQRAAALRQQASRICR